MGMSSGEIVSWGGKGEMGAWGGKGEMGSMGGMGGKDKGGKGKSKRPKPGDWYCPGCGDLQFSRNFECRRCSTPKPEGIHNAGMKPGDWHCPLCGDIQFARNTECRKCGAPNPDPASSAAAMEVAMSSKFTEKPGDWYCPSCGDLQFAKNLQCRKCGTPTPDPEAAQAAAAAFAAKGSRQEAKPGDWHCTSCGDLQFAKNQQCRRCGTPNYQSMVLSMTGQDTGKGKGGKMAMGPQVQINPMQAAMGTMTGNEEIMAQALQLGLAMMGQAAMIGKSTDAPVAGGVAGVPTAADYRSSPY